MGKLSREKGKRGEREAAALFTEITGIPWRRGAQFSGDPDAPDIRPVLPEWFDKIRVRVEVKRTKRSNARLRAALAQALRDDPGRHPLVVARDDEDTEWLAVCRARDLLEIARQLMAAGA